MSKTKKSSTKVPENILKLINENPRKYAEEADIKELVKILRILSNIYYNTGESVVSDEIFDLMKDTLEIRDPENQFLSEIGAPIEKNKILLPYAMGSLTKIKTEAELNAWKKKYPGPYLCSAKLDGASGQYYKAKQDEYNLYSRGDGLTGRDISHLNKFVVPRTVRNDLIPVDTSVRGEIIISKKDFKKIAGQMKNARNAASGVINSKTVDKNVAKLCQFVTYSILHPEYRHDEQMKILEDYGFKVVDYRILDDISFKILSDYFIELRENYEFEVDGVVVYDCSRVYSHKPGKPEHGFAFKTALEDQIVEATIKTVHWQPNMDGYLKPIAEIYPMTVSGVTITRVTAFNARFVVDNKLGPGCVIKLIRSGDVIPNIISIVQPADEPQMPEVAYRWNETRVDIILKDLYGAQADAVMIRLISHFFATLGVEFVGEGIVAKFVNSGYKTIPDVVDALKNKKEDLAEIEGIGVKMIDKIWTGLDKALANTDLATFMASSHVFGRGFGRRRIREILAEYPDIMNEKWNIKTMTEKIENIKGFSTITARQFAEHFSEFKKFYNEINKIIDISYLKDVVEEDEKEQENQYFKDMTFVFTGFRDKDLEKKITDLGGRVGLSVSSKTTAVIKADGSEEKSGKIAQAEKNKVRIMTKTEFINKYKL